MLKAMALRAIVLYQRHLSPRKGFGCAYRIHTGHASCSALGYRAIRRLGVWCGLIVLRKRLARCGAVHRRCASVRPRLHSQAGFCDISCDLPCDCDVLGSAADAVSNCDLSLSDGCDCCDCGDFGSSRKKNKGEKWVGIPPGTKFERDSSIAGRQ